MKNFIKKISFLKSYLKNELKDGLIFPVTFDHGFKVKLSWSEFKRGFLKKRWQFLFFTYTMIITAGFGYLLYDKLNTQAATYGFNQSSWSEADINAIALHDSDQDNYYKYYYKNNNIDLSETNKVKLLNASTTIIDTNTNDFNNGTFNNSEIKTTNNSIYLDSCFGENFSANICWTYLGRSLNYSACSDACSNLHNCNVADATDVCKLINNDTYKTKCTKPYYHTWSSSGHTRGTGGGWGYCADSGTISSSCCVCTCDSA